VVDLQEATRRDDVYNEINEIIDKISTLPVFPSLVWVWCWDVIKNEFQNNQLSDNPFTEEVVPADVDLKQIWDRFWTDVDKNGFSLEYGSEDLHEAIVDWMRDCNFLVALEDDQWLDEDSDEESDTTTEYGMQETGFKAEPVVLEEE
jgi:hypothetical protein